MVKKSLLFYSSRIVQRIALFTAIGATLVHWMTLIAITVSLSFTGELESNNFRNSELVNDKIERVINLQSLIVLRWIVISVVITCLLTLISQYRKQEKPMLLDSLTIVLFCLVSVIFSQLIIRSFASHLL